jgi:hypothetical protein
MNSLLNPDNLPGQQRELVLFFFIRCSYDESETSGRDIRVVTAACNFYPPQPLRIPILDVNRSGVLLFIFVRALPQ